MAWIAAALLLLIASTPGFAIFVLRYNSSAPPGRPVGVELSLPHDVQLNTLLVRGSEKDLPYKLERTGPRSRLSWVSNGAETYFISYEAGPGGGVGAGLLPEMSSPVIPAMIGSGDRVMYGRPGVHGKLGVGLWAHPAPIDFDGDGDMDMIIGCPDHPFNGTYLFRNAGSNASPLYDRGEWIGPGRKDLVVADFNGDGQLDLVSQGGYYTDVRLNRMNRWVVVPIVKTYHVGRDELWYPVDWDKDGNNDLLVGASDWREYGWDDAFDTKGNWTRGPLHGYVWYHRNLGTNVQPRFGQGVQLQAGGKPIDLYGSPSPIPVDWFGKGVLDLIGGDFLDTVTLFRRGPDGLLPGEKIQVAGKTYHADLCMIQPRVAQWHPDGRPSLIVGEEDGTVALLENVAPRPEAPRFEKVQYLKQVDPFLKSGALSRPVGVDWDGDGDLDLIAGNSAGYIQFFRNTGTRAAPTFEDQGYLEAAGKVIRRIAGPNGSIQGPAEAKWGYSNPSVADWDGDGDLDILVNDIWGSVHWYQNTGTRTAPKLAAAANIDVEWEGPAPKPAWNWWNPVGKQLVTQWRTTPRIVDWNRDGLPDLAMLDHEGFLALYRRARKDGQLVLLPPERIFLDPAGSPLLMSRGRAGKSGRRKIDFADWDRDGDLDLITDGTNGADLFENTGSQEKPVFMLRGLINRTRTVAGHNPCPNVADWNGDGRPDLMIGGEDGFFYYFERSFLDGK
ncbi:MAG: VCBS repeat-containing protein [Acidobacteria bacterium]|nr:VCBS repeat-containing protein [Acidobacteriota bacterium]